MNMKRREIGNKRGKLNTAALAAGVAVVAVSILIHGYVMRDWKGSGRFTVIDLRSDAAEIESFDPQVGMGSRLVIPADVEIETVGGRGRWRVGVMKELAAKYGLSWAVDSIADYLGIGYTVAKGEMGWWDRRVFAKYVSSGTWRNYNFVDAGWAQEIKAVDEAISWQLGGRWEKAAFELFASSQFIAEKVEVTVVNTVDAVGMGGHAARVIESSGLTVVMVSEGVEPVAGCKLEVPVQLAEKKAVDWMRGYFKCDQETATSGDGVRLSLGQDYQKWWLGEGD